MAVEPGSRRGGSFWKIWSGRTTTGSPHHDWLAAIRESAALTLGVLPWFLRENIMWSPDAKWVEWDFHTVQSLAVHPTRMPANSTTAIAGPKRIGSSVREADEHRDRGTPQNTPRPSPGTNTHADLATMPDPVPC